MLTYKESQITNINTNKILNLDELIKKYYDFHPDPDNKFHQIKFGTSGHRGSSERYSFNESHIIAITQAIINQRIKKGITGPCYIGKDTHALSEPAFISILEVLIANRINVIIQHNYDYTPTPVISHAILLHNNNLKVHENKADGIIITSSHNPPEDGGIKYNLPNGGPADDKVTNFIEKNANFLLKNKLHGIKRFNFQPKRKNDYIHFINVRQKYIRALDNIIDMQSIRESDIKMAADPLGGSSITYWQNIAQYYKINLKITNENINKTFSFINKNFHNIIKIDCCSEHAISRALELRNKFDLIFINDPDCDRHGIITSSGLVPANNYLAIAIYYLFQNRPLWQNNIGIGKTLVTSTLIDKIANNYKKHLFQTSVGFKWFAKKIFNGTLGFSGEESAGGTFLTFHGYPWSTDKDGIIMCLLAAEIIANTKKNIEEHWNNLIYKFGSFSYNCVQIPITKLQKACITKYLSKLADIKILADYRIIYKTYTLSKYKIINCIKLITKNGWCAARLSGTEEICKIYCESFIDDNHRIKIETEVIHIMNTIMNL